MDDPPIVHAYETADKPLVLVARQDAITIEIADDGSLILREDDALGDRSDTIMIAAGNLERFIDVLFDAALPQACFQPRALTTSASSARSRPMPAINRRNPRASTRPPSSGSVTGLTLLVPRGGGITASVIQASAPAESVSDATADHGVSDAAPVSKLGPTMLNHFDIGEDGGPGDAPSAPIVRSNDLADAYDQMR
jgi:hypothetical protein